MVSSKDKLCAWCEVDEPNDNARDVKLHPGRGIYLCEQCREVADGKGKKVETLIPGKDPEKKHRPKDLIASDKMTDIVGTLDSFWIVSSHPLELSVVVNGLTISLTKTPARRLLFHLQEFGKLGSVCAGSIKMMWDKEKSGEFINKMAMLGSKTDLRYRVYPTGKAFAVMGTRWKMVNVDDVALPFLENVDPDFDFSMVVDQPSTDEHGGILTMTSHDKSRDFTPVIVVDCGKKDGIDPVLMWPIARMSINGNKIIFPAIKISKVRDFKEQVYGGFDFLKVMELKFRASEDIPIGSSNINYTLNQAVKKRFISQTAEKLVLYRVALSRGKSLYQFVQDIAHVATHTPDDTPRFRKEVRDRLSRIAGRLITEVEHEKK